MKLWGILDDIEFKGNKTNILLKWVIGLAGSAIVGAFIVGQVKMTRLNKLDDIEALAKQGIEATKKLEAKVDANSKKTNAKINKVYTDGMEAFEEYRQFNNEQFKLIIDYGETNKELLKKMLELNSQEKAQQIESDLEKNRREMPESDPQFLAVIEEPKENDNSLPQKYIFQEIATGKNTYLINGAPRNYLDTLNLDKFIVVEKIKSERFEGLYNFKYRDK